MNERAAAEEHLRAIRSLMERATVYRAISAPTALVGGIAAVAVSAWLLRTSHDSERISGDTLQQEFVFGWMAALVITVAANTLFLWRGAVRGKRPFFSPGLRLAVRSLLPSFLVAAVATLVIAARANLATTAVLSVIWMGLYGLALLATATFSPRSLVILGWAFVLSACFWASLLGSRWLWGDGNPAWEIHRQATLAMALTFGVFHLIYAACTWRRGAVADDGQVLPE